jgi:hypothetical protein
MSKTESITFSATRRQKQQIVTQAKKQDENVSEFCLKAVEQRLARELQDQRVNELGLGTEFEQLTETITSEVEGVTDVETRQELYYSVALWELVSSEYPAEKRAKAMEKAPQKLAENTANLREKEAGDR